MKIPKNCDSVEFYIKHNATVFVISNIVNIYFDNDNEMFEVTHIDCGVFKVTHIKHEDIWGFQLQKRIEEVK